MTAWWEGRRFFACRCGARDEETAERKLSSLDCWMCHAPDSMKEWWPPEARQAKEQSNA